MFDREDYYPSEEEYDHSDQDYEEEQEPNIQQNHEERGEEEVEEEQNITYENDPETENYECEYFGDDDLTLRKCSGLDIYSVGKELGRGSFGVVYSVLIGKPPNQNTVVMKKIETAISKYTSENSIIENMYYEIEYSYKMGNSGVGPRVYDSFYYIHNKIVTQFILMEKFDSSVSRWMMSHSSVKSRENCTKVVTSMLDLVYRQVFELNIYCLDIKVENFVINTNPIDVKMIDFGIDWCTMCKLPRMYLVLRELRIFSIQQKKEIFYSLCTLQLMINIHKLRLPSFVDMFCFEPFYKDKIFTKYVLASEFPNQVKYKSPLVKKRRSYNRHIDVPNIRKILKSVLDYQHDHAQILKHYLSNGRKNIDNSRLVTETFQTLKNITAQIYNTPKNISPHSGTHSETSTGSFRLPRSTGLTQKLDSLNFI